MKLLVSLLLLSSVSYGTTPTENINEALGLENMLSNRHCTEAYSKLKQDIISTNLRQLAAIINEYGIDSEEVRTVTDQLDTEFTNMRFDITSICTG